MKSIACFLLLFFCAAILPAQAPSPTPGNPAVSIQDEPHHHLIFENPYVRVYRLEIISPDATLLHRHEVPYIYMSIGKAEFTNAVEGRSEIRLKMSDGQLGYSPGGFAHVIRTVNDTPFYNITIELLHTQGSVRSACANVSEGPIEACADPQTSSPASASSSDGAPDGVNKVGASAPAVFTPVLETDEIVLQSTSFPAKANYALRISPAGTLLIVRPLSQFKLDFADGSSKLLSGGDPLWLAPGSHVTITNVSEGKSSVLLLFSFKDTAKSVAN